MVINVTPTRVVAGAIASRDFMPVHHDRDYANQQGAPDIFMNILTTNGYVARFVTDWAGPDAQLKSIAIRPGAPAMPGFVRDRLIAGAMVPAVLVNQAQKFRRWYRERVLELVKDVDVILAPATPCTAPRIGQKSFMLDGVEMALRPNIGIYTQPISFIGLPVVAAPIPLTPLPIAVQIIAAPWREDAVLRVAQALEQAGAAGAPRPDI